MYGVAQAEAEAAVPGRMRSSLRTGDRGCVVHLWNCIQATAVFPTLDRFFDGRPAARAQPNS